MQIGECKQSDKLRFDLQIPVYRAVLFAKSGANSIYDSLIWLYLNCESVPPPSMVCTWIRWYLFSVLATLPAGGVTFLSRQESNQRSDQRRGAEQFSYRNSLLFGTFLPGKNHPLLWTPLPALRSCRYLVSNRFLSLRDNILNPCPLGHTFTPHHSGVLHAAGASQPTSVGCLTPTAGGYFTRSEGAINCDLTFKFLFIALFVRIVLRKSINRIRRGRRPRLPPKMFRNRCKRTVRRPVPTVRYDNLCV